MAYASKKSMLSAQRILAPRRRAQNLDSRGERQFGASALRKRSRER